MCRCPSQPCCSQQRPLLTFMDNPLGCSPAAGPPGLLDLPALFYAKLWPLLDRGTQRALRATSRSGRNVVRASTTQLEVTGSVGKLLALELRRTTPNLQTFSLGPLRVTTGLQADRPWFMWPGPWWRCPVCGTWTSCPGVRVAYMLEGLR